MAGVTLGFLKFVLGFDTIAFKKGMSAAERDLVGMQKNFAKVGKGMTSLGKSMSLAISAPLIGLGVVGFKMAADFETAMNSVGISTQATAQEMKQMNDLALQIGKDTPKSASEAASAMDMLAKAGMRTTDILHGGAKAVVALAVATGSELDPAASALTDAMANFGIKAKDLPAVIDNITGAVNESKLDFSDFQLAMGQAGGVAGASGVAFKDFTAVLAATAPAFSSGADAGTSFKTFLQRLTPQTTAQAALFKQFGLSFYTATGQMKPMAEVAQILQDKFAGLSQKARGDVFRTLFGTDAIRTAIGLMKQGSDGITQMQDRIAKTDATKQAEQRMKGFNAALEQLKGSLETLAIKIAQSGLLDSMTKLADKAGVFVDWLGTLDKSTLNWGVTIAGVAAIIGPFLIVLGTLVGAIAKMGPLVSLLVKGFVLFRDVMIAVRIATVALMPALLPFLPWLIAIAAAVGAVYLAWKYWPQIVAFIKPIYDAVKTWLFDKLNVVWDWIKGRIGAVADWFKWLYDKIVGHSYVPDLVDGVGKHFKRLHKNMVTPAQKAAKETAQAFEDLATRIGGILDRIFPDAAKARQFRDDLRDLEAGMKRLGYSAEQTQAAIQALILEHIGATAPVADPKVTLDDVLAEVDKSTGEMETITKKSTAEMAKAWGDMAVQAIGSMKEMVTQFKSGDILGGIQSLLQTVMDVIEALGNIGVLHLNAAPAGFGGTRALGGPVVPGKSYLVGEHGPEFVTPRRSGFVHPNGANAQPQRLVVVPSAYFDVVVDHRAANVAAPMMGQAAMIGVAGSEARSARRSRRNLLAA